MDNATNGSKNSTITGRDASKVFNNIETIVALQMENENLIGRVSNLANRVQSLPGQGSAEAEQMLNSSAVTRTVNGDLNEIIKRMENANADLAEVYKRLELSLDY